MTQLALLKNITIGGLTAHLAVIIVATPLQHEFDDKSLASNPKKFK